MDDLDRRLIALLRDNARLPVATLAQDLGVSRGTVQNRIDRLVADGRILGFTLRLGGDEDPGLVRAITMVQEQTKNAASVIEALRQIPEARAIHTTNGRWDIAVDMVADSLADLDEALTLIRRIDGVVSTETIILLTTHKI
ncbi:MAG: Lrp/AsnC family transcriptional regulator [Rhodospirillaceae bacterium]|nr:Lrp/AsnC family transcriptional regulator [Rhodospirillaceae bacterium]MEA4838238.1 Lrp/AsnC family transcriptional regulator [Rhodospirillaceae bacterium]